MSNEDRKFSPIDPDLLVEQLDEVPEEELTMVRSKLEAAETKRGIVRSEPDLSRMSDVEFQNYRIKKYGF